MAVAHVTLRGCDGSPDGILYPLAGPTGASRLTGACRGSGAGTHRFEESRRLLDERPVSAVFDDHELRAPDGLGDLARADLQVGDSSSPRTTSVGTRRRRRPGRRSKVEASSARKVAYGAARKPVRAMNEARAVPARLRS